MSAKALVVSQCEMAFESSIMTASAVYVETVPDMGDILMAYEQRQRRDYMAWWIGQFMTKEYGRLQLIPLGPEVAI